VKRSGASVAPFPKMRDSAADASARVAAGIDGIFFAT
jgi:hypothetical protein